VTTSVLQQVPPLVEQSSQPCLRLNEQISALTARYLSEPSNPTTTMDFENALRLLLDECGRQIIEAVFNHIEPEHPQDAPKHMQWDRLDYSRKNHKSVNRGGIATLFGTIQLHRCLYEPLQEARDDSQPAFAPLEKCLGVVALNATPALAERVGRLSSQHTQQQMLDILERDHHVVWSVKVLRGVAAAVSVGITPYLRTAQRETLLRWLAEAQQSRGRYRPVLAVGRDGIMLPIRDEGSQKEGGVGTVSVYDRRGRRLGTVYLGEMPQPLQVTLRAELTALLNGVLTSWEGPTPRLVYVTDAGYHQTTYFEEDLSKMENPRRAGELLEWRWIVDYYHAASYVSQLANLLFGEEKTRQSWSRRQRLVLRDEDRGVIRVLCSASQHHGKKSWTMEQEKEYAEAYNYLLKHSPEMEYSKHKRLRLPIGSGVTEAGCKVVFTQRFKDSGMTWSLEGGEVILRLRLAVLSGVWDVVYREYLNHRPFVPLATPQVISPQTSQKAA
jgi:hypothetical protein